MSRKVLILRPQPGAGRTAHRAVAMGLEPIIAPLFMVRPLAWQAPDPKSHDALLLTSANAALHAGGGLTSYADLPCYAVGAATAKAAVEAGLDRVISGSADSGALLDRMVADGIRLPIHLCGREHALPHRPDIEVTSVPVYGADSVEALPSAAAQAVESGTLALFHSPRAARLFRTLIGGDVGRTRITAISASAASAAGPGWAAIAVATEPTDQALLEAAAKLCHRGG